MNHSIKGYKATYNYKWRDQHFEIGQTYELEGEPIMCVNGFHFCLNMSDVLKYYPYKPNEFKLLEVESLGEIVGKGNKLCTNKIKILREVPMEEWGFYKDLPNGHYEIHYKNSDEIECWKEYDERGNEIHYKDSNGGEYYYEYDENGNLTHYKNFNGYEYWKEYDENGNMIHYKNSRGYECWKKYNKKGKLIHYKSSC